VTDHSLDAALAERLTRAARATQDLCDVLWEALHEELSDRSHDGPRAQRVAELSERVADISATVAALASDAAHAPLAPQPPVSREQPVPREPPVPPGPPVSPESPATPDPSVVFAAPAASAAPAMSRPPEPSSGAVIVDEREGASTSSPPVVAPEAPQVSQARQAQARPLPWDTAPQAPQATPQPQIEIRDARGEEGPAAWIGSIGRQLERFERDGLPFAVLLAELVDVERLHRAELPEEVSRLTSQVESALAAELRQIGGAPADGGGGGAGRSGSGPWPASLTRESPGRYWLLAPETDGIDAGALAERLARAVRRSVSHRGAPLEVAVGTAVCPEDGREAAALAAHADVGLYAARAAGRSSVGRLIVSVDKPV
jgi:hypothetical protein